MWGKNDSTPNCLSWLQKGGGGDKRRKQIRRPPVGADFPDAARPSIVATLGYQPRNLQEPLSPRGNSDRVLGFKTFSVEPKDVQRAPAQQGPNRDELGTERGSPQPSRAQLETKAMATTPARLQLAASNGIQRVQSPDRSTELVSIEARTKTEASHNSTVDFDTECVQEVPIEAVKQKLPVETVTPGQHEPRLGGDDVRAKLALFETLMSATSVIREQRDSSDKDEVQPAVLTVPVTDAEEKHGDRRESLKEPAANSSAQPIAAPATAHAQQSESELLLDLQEMDSSDDEGPQFPAEPEQMPQQPQTQPLRSDQHQPPNQRWSPNYNSTAWVSDLLQDDPTVVVTMPPAQRGPSAEEVRLFSNDLFFRQTKSAEPPPASGEASESQRLRLSATKAVPCFRYRSGSAGMPPRDQKAIDQAISAAPTPQHMSEQSTNSVPSLPSCLGTPRDQPPAAATTEDRSSMQGVRAGGAGAAGGMLRGATTSVFRVSEMQTESRYCQESLIQRIELDLQMLDTDDSNATSARSSPVNFADRERVGLLC